MTQNKKTTLISLKVDSSTKALLEEAAKAANQNVSDFILNTSLYSARQVVDGRIIYLDDAAWAEFNDLLDQPVQDNPRLRKLLTEPSVSEKK